ncbi:hypothetical protein [Candidatus Uabimicrobium sp. HlEnr_7]|uniref:hypothetical protein n=1 Tax=Candidatus Uabimicrobium helgolandensis TaxID=3095367 RepID=UPI0035590191
MRYILFTLLLLSITFADSLEIYPRSAKMKSGSSIHFSVVATDQDGNMYTPQGINWIASYGNVRGGMYTAPSQHGNYTVTARWRGYTATANIKIKRPQNTIKSIVITPRNQKVEINRGVYFKAIAYDHYNREVPLRAAKWWADGGKIDQNGYYRASYRPGRYTVWVQDTYSGLKASTSVEIFRKVVQPPRLHHIAITPRNQRIGVGAYVQLKAIGYDSYNRPVSFTPKWWCDGGTVSANGYYQAPNRPGYYKVWVQDNYGIKTSTTVEVIRSTIPHNPPSHGSHIYKIVITPRNQRIAVGKGVYLKAIAYDKYDRVVNFRGKWWCDGGTINENGYYQAGYKPGTYTVWVQDNRSRVKASTNVTILRNTVPPYNPPQHGGKARIEVTHWDVNKGNLFSRSRVRVKFTVHGKKAHKVALFGIYPTGKVVELRSASCSNGENLHFREKYSYNISRLELRVYNSWDKEIAKYSGSGR